ncbi:MAG TPA: hypothetical protein PLZ69_00945 [Candidatus Pacearchaeota archaeon]|nr:hypothetical protein [Candidatus Pacearchaeota archaeon]
MATIEDLKKRILESDFKDKYRLTADRRTVASSDVKLDAPLAFRPTNIKHELVTQEPKPKVNVPVTEPVKESKPGIFDRLAGVAGAIGKGAGTGLKALADNRESLAKIAAGLAASGYNPGGKAAPNEWLGQGYMQEADQLREERMADEARQDELMKLALKQSGTGEKNEALFDRISASEKDVIQGFNQIQPQLERANELLSSVPEDRLGAQFFEWKSKLMPDKEQQELRSTMDLLVQAIVKSYQGSRPSDKDLEVIKGAVDAISKGREQAYAALRELVNVTNKRKELFANTIASGYNIPKETVYKTLTPTTGINIGGSATNKDPLGLGI